MAKLLPKPPGPAAGWTDGTAKSLGSHASTGDVSPCTAQTLSLSPSLTCARLFPCTAVPGPGSDVVQQRAAEEPFVQLCLQGPDMQPDAHQPPLAADLQREGQCQGQLCQAGKILHGDTGKESPREGVTQLPAGEALGTARVAQSPAAVPSLGNALDQVLRVSHRASAQAPSGIPPFPCTHQLTAPEHFAVHLGEAHLAAQAGERRELMEDTGPAASKPPCPLFYAGHGDPKSLLHALLKAEHPLTLRTAQLENTQLQLPVKGQEARSAHVSHHG